MILMAFTAAITSNPNFSSRLKIKYLWETSKWERFAQLLDDPTARRMPRDVGVPNVSTIVADDEEARRR
jgi:hypothetical protein